MRERPLRLILLLCGALLTTSACVIDLPERRFDGGAVVDQLVRDQRQDLPPADLGVDQEQLCGNGKLDTGELCDIAIVSPALGACPTAASCEDGEACTANTLEGPGTCQARCTLKLITTCVAGDGCCPAGCDSSSDDDCSSTCGNNTKDALETCDGDCPTSCAPKTCQSGQIVGSADNCAAHCLYIPAGEGTTCSGGQGRCHAGNCCTVKQCWDGASCRDGDVDAACGGLGDECTDCASLGKCCDAITQLCKAC